MLKIRRALISVSNKEGIIEFTRLLHKYGVELISTGGTHQLLSSNGIPVRQVSEVTGFPEILDGRVKTLHPAIHGGLLARLDLAEHRDQLAAQHIVPIDMVVVNLYPFASTIAKPDVTHEEAIENIDIGGPSMIRSGAKNYKFTAVLTDPSQYNSIGDHLLKNDCTLSEEMCYSLATNAFQHTAQYDTMISQYFKKLNTPASMFPDALNLSYSKYTDLRYGENPHQHAAVYGNFLEVVEKLHGKELSFNNIIDANAAYYLIHEFDTPACVIIKHTNPCGVGVADTLAEAYHKAFATDTKSPFGGIIAVNRELDMEAANAINSIFTEIIMAPDFAPGVLEFLMKKKDRRVLRIKESPKGAHWDIRSVAGGILVQTADHNVLDLPSIRCVTKRQPTESEYKAMMFGWKVAKHIKSNAIVYALKDRTVGIGAGQMSRVDSSKIAVWKSQESGLSLKGSIVASDAFFPFADGLLEAVAAGATAVIQPGGSIRDEEVIQAANDHDIAMIFTGIRHFKH